jgi:hypothetical protein
MLAVRRAGQVLLAGAERAIQVTVASRVREIRRAAIADGALVASGPGRPARQLRSRSRSELDSGALLSCQLVNPVRAQVEDVAVLLNSHAELVGAPGNQGR